MQTVGGFWGGTLLGLVPFGGTAEDLAEQGDLVHRGTPAAQRGKAIGLILGGTYTMVSGAGGEILGGAATATGVGAAVGVPAIVVSTGMVLGGAANVYTGVQSLMAGPKEGGTSGASGGTATAKPARAAPNPHGRKGGLAHRGKVKEISAKIESRGLLPGRQTKAGQPVAREAQALDDIEEATGTRPTFHPYNYRSYRRKRGTPSVFLRNT
ncbi:MAG: hypothetical protein R3B70_21240 [Polyangiaceae bacterium]